VLSFRKWSLKLFSKGLACLASFPPCYRQPPTRGSSTEPKADQYMYRVFRPSLVMMPYATPELRTFGPLAGAHIAVSVDPSRRPRCGSVGVICGCGARASSRPTAGAVRCPRSARNVCRLIEGHRITTTEILTRRSEGCGSAWSYTVVQCDRPESSVACVRSCLWVAASGR
jgi:hypothetical protein